MGPAQSRSEGKGARNSGVALHDISEAEFRANPAYDLILFDRLPPDEQEVLKDLKNDPDFYGVLLPRAAGAHAIKSVCRDTALLYLTLAQPGRLPSYVHAMFGAGCNQAVAELVLDGVLEIAREGRFVSGSQAHDAIYPHEAGAEPAGTLARLSHAALSYGEALDLDDSARLSARLYFYNRIPISAHWIRRFCSQEAVADAIGIDDQRARIERRWSRVHQPPNNSHSGFKLYVSPRPEFVREAFAAVVESLKDSGAHHFKVGNDAAGLLRPDKLVLYFRSFDSLQQAAQQILTHLRGCEAQGVPFTAEITGDGLLSWGFDPPPDKGALAWRERESWRLWVTNRLATAMLAARRNGVAEIGPAQFALDRLRLEGIDTDTWAPTDSFGRPAGD